MAVTELTLQEVLAALPPLARSWVEARSTAFLVEMEELREDFGALPSGYDEPVAALAAQLDDEFPARDAPARKRRDLERGLCVLAASPPQQAEPRDKRPSVAEVKAAIRALSPSDVESLWALGEPQLLGWALPQAHGARLDRALADARVRSTSLMDLLRHYASALSPALHTDHRSAHELYR